MWPVVGMAVSALALLGCTIWYSIEDRKHPIASAVATSALDKQPVAPPLPTEPLIQVGKTGEQISFSRIFNASPNNTGEIRADGKQLSFDTIVNNPSLTAQDIDTILKAREVIPSAIDPGLTALSANDLRQGVRKYATAIRRMEQTYDAGLANPDMNVKKKAFSDRNSDFQQNYKARGRALLNTLLQRLNQPADQNLLSETSVLEPENTVVAGFHPLIRMADALDNLAARLQ